MSDTAIAVIKTALPTILGADQNDILGKLAEKVKAHKPDVSTPAGRAEIRALAAEVASSKVALIKLGKSLTEDWRNKTKAVNAECNVIEGRMDALKVQVRQPLTDFESIEEARVAAHEKALRELCLFAVIPPGWPSGHIATRLDEFQTSELRFREWQEFRDRASNAAAALEDSLRNALTVALNREAQEAEFARLKAEESERQRIAAIEAQRVREERIAIGAAEVARQAAETRAARLAEETRQALEAAEQRRVAAEARAERERQQAIADRMQAIADERQRIANERAAEEAMAMARAANLAHRKGVNNEALEDLTNMVDFPVSEDTARAIIAAVARGAIRHLKVEY